MLPFTSITHQIFCVKHAFLRVLSFPTIFPEDIHVMDENSLDNTEEGVEYLFMTSARSVDT
jgi:hypothetical protein